MYKELEIYPIEYICRVQLDNGTTIYVLPDGTADGNDGKRYSCINHMNDEGEVVIDGWEEIN